MKFNSEKDSRDSKRFNLFVVSGHINSPVTVFKGFRVQINLSWQIKVGDKTVSPLSLLFVVFTMS